MKNEETQRVFTNPEQKEKSTSVGHPRKVFEHWLSHKRIKRNAVQLEPNQNVQNIDMNISNFKSSTLANKQFLQNIDQSSLQSSFLTS